MQRVPRIAAGVTTALEQVSNVLGKGAKPGASTLPKPAASIVPKPGASALPMPGAGPLPKPKVNTLLESHAGTVDAFKQHVKEAFGERDGLIDGRNASRQNETPGTRETSERPATTTIDRLIGRNVTAEAVLQIPGQKPIVLEVKPGKLSKEDEVEFQTLTEKYVQDPNAMPDAEHSRLRDLQLQRSYNGGREAAREHHAALSGKTFVAMTAGSGHDLADAAELANAVAKDDGIATLATPSGGWGQNLTRHFNGGPLANQGSCNSIYAQGFAAELAHLDKSISAHSVSFSQGSDASRNGQAALNPEQLAHVKGVTHTTMGGSAAQMPDHNELSSGNDVVPLAKMFRVLETSKSGKANVIPSANAHDGKKYAEIFRTKVLKLPPQQAGDE